MIYVSLIYVSMKKQASKEIYLWVGRSPIGLSSQYRTFVPPLGGVITWHILSALKKLDNLASHFRVSAENQLFRRTVLSFSSFSGFWNVAFYTSFCTWIVAFLVHLLFS